MRACANCGRENPDPARFCSQCGSEFSQCSVCGTEAVPDARFCVACGASLAGGTDAGLSGVMAELGVREALRKRLLTDVAGEHRVVTVVFADLVGSVARTRDLQPEEAAGFVNSLLEAIVEVLVRSEGRIDRFLGDGVLAVFGTPAIHENDPERAVQSALEIVDRAEELGLGVTVGINTGRVFFGPIGSDLHEEITVMGPVVDLAARLQGAAGPGEVLIGSETRDQVQAAFELERCLLTIKGIEGEVSAYRARRLLDSPERVRGIAGLRADLVGRDEELNVLLEHTAAGGRCIALMGEAGVGKSRLIAEIHARTTGEWLEGRCRELTVRTAYAPIRDLLHRRISSTRSIESELTDLVGAGALHNERVSEIGPLLRYLLDQNPADPIASMDAERRKTLIKAAVLEYLQALGSRRPTVLFVDDLHWGDDLSADLLTGLLPRLEASNLTLVTAYRPDPDSPATEFAARARSIPNDQFHEIRIHSLSPAQAHSMIRSMLRIDDLPEKLEDAIVNRAGGNPFFVEELIRSLIQRGFVRFQDDRWVADPHVREIAIPVSIETLVMSRIDRLAQPVRLAARFASILGRTFSAELFTALAGSSLVAALDTLAYAGFLSRERGSSTELSFVHDLTREAIYEGILPSRRAELHEQAGAALESSGSPAGQVADHYARSRNHSKAVEWLFRAGREAMDAFQNEYAASIFKTGLARTNELDDETRARWLGIYRARQGEVLERQGRHAEAREQLQAALAAGIDDPLDQARIELLIGQTFRLEGQLDDALSWYDRAEASLDRSSDRDTTAVHRMWIEFQKERGYALYFGGRPDELDAHNRLLATAVRQHGSAAQRTDLLLGQLMQSFSRERFSLSEATVDIARAAMTAADQSGDPGRVAEARFPLGFALLWADRIAEAEPVLRTAVQGAVRIEDAVLENRARSYHAVALRRMGKVEETRAAAETALEVATRLDDGYYRGHALANLAWVGWRDGRFNDAADQAERAVAAWTESEEGGIRGLMTEFAWLVVWPMAAVASQTGDLTEALRWLQYLLVPWERSMPPALVTAVEQAVEGADGAKLTKALDLAVEAHLL